MNDFRRKINEEIENNPILQEKIYLIFKSLTPEEIDNIYNTLEKVDDDIKTGNYVNVKEYKYIYRFDIIPEYQNNKVYCFLEFLRYNYYTIIENRERFLYLDENDVIDYFNTTISGAELQNNIQQQKLQFSKDICDSMINFIDNNKNQLSELSVYEFLSKFEDELNKIVPKHDWISDKFTNLLEIFVGKFEEYYQNNISDNSLYLMFENAVKLILNKDESSTQGNISKLFNNIRQKYNKIQLLDIVLHKYEEYMQNITLPNFNSEWDKINNVSHDKNIALMYNSVLDTLIYFSNQKQLGETKAKTIIDFLTINNDKINSLNSQDATTFVLREWDEHINSWNTPVNEFFVLKYLIPQFEVIYNEKPETISFKGLEIILNKSINYLYNNCSDDIIYSVLCDLTTRNNRNPEVQSIFHKLHRNLENYKNKVNEKFDNCEEYEQWSVKFIKNNFTLLTEYQINEVYLQTEMLEWQGLNKYIRPIKYNDYIKEGSTDSIEQYLYINYINTIFSIIENIIPEPIVEIEEIPEISEEEKQQILNDNVNWIIDFLLENNKDLYKMPPQRMMLCIGDNMDENSNFEYINLKQLATEIVNQFNTIYTENNESIQITALEAVLRYIIKAAYMEFNNLKDIKSICSEINKCKPLHKDVKTLIKQLKQQMTEFVKEAKDLKQFNEFDEYDNIVYCLTMF